MSKTVFGTVPVPDAVRTYVETMVKDRGAVATALALTIAEGTLKRVLQGGNVRRATLAQLELSAGLGAVPAPEAEVLASIQTDLVALVARMDDYLARAH